MRLRNKKYENINDKKQESNEEIQKTMTKEAVAHRIKHSTNIIFIKSGANQNYC